MLLDIGGVPLLEFLVRRLSHARHAKRIVIATAENTENDTVAALGQRLGIPVFRGAEDDVLGRYMGAVAATGEPVQRVVRVTGDNPLTDPALFDHTVDALVENDADYTFPADLPAGTAVDVFSLSALQRCAAEASTARHREHINALILDRPGDFIRADVPLETAERRPDIRVTVDTPDDLAFVRALVDNHPAPETMSVTDIVNAAVAVPRSAAAT